MDESDAPGSVSSKRIDDAAVRKEDKPIARRFLIDRMRSQSVSEANSSSINSGNSSRIQSAIDVSRSTVKSDEQINSSD